MEEQRHKKEHRYLAMIAAEIRKTVAKHPKQVRPDDFLIVTKLIKKGPPLSPQERMRRSKAAWGMALGIEELKKEARN
jgi:hypothetical protein